MARYIELAPQLVRLYRLDLDCKEVIKEFLLTAVTADVVEVVRCKECKHSTEELVKPYCNLHDMNVDNVYFCADGKRRANDATIH